MKRTCLESGQRRTLSIIENLGFGRIERLSILDGEPCYDPPPRIVQVLKLAADQGRAPRNSPDTIEKTFQELFTALSRLRVGVVDIEVRHGLPFRMTLDRELREFEP
jgi:hypothetical protein